MSDAAATHRSTRLWHSLSGDVATLRTLMRGADAAEIRLDRCRLTPDEVREVFSGARIPMLATHHGDGGDELLIAAIDAGTDWIDLPLGPDGVDQRLLAYAHEHGTRVVASYHDYDGTPSADELHDLIEREFATGADAAKVACAVATAQEAARIISLMDDPRPVVAVGMGDAGRITRLAGAVFGCPFCFVAPDREQLTAPGQLDSDSLRAAMRLLGEGQ